MNIDIVTKTKKWKGREKLVEKITKKLLPLALSSSLKRKAFRGSQENKLLRSSTLQVKNDEMVEVSISLVSDAQMKKINFQFREKNKPTNVLSFPAFDNLFLGDIVIAYETLEREAKEQKKTFNDHLTHLILHSILHLLGHDHEEEKMAQKMEKLEVKILHQLGISNPYQLKK